LGEILVGNTVIKIEHLSKKYRLGVINNGTLFRDIQSWMALKQGKEDPHAQIGATRYATSKDFFWALKDLNLEIKEGDRVGIMGKNGAGKSTLLKLLSRITSPSEGVIKIRGKVSSLLEVGTGFHGELTGRENIYLNGAILGMKRREVSRKLDEIIAFSGISEHLDTPVKRYSSGMYVRLAFAVAAHLDSDILIADEVLAVGDSEFQKKALGKMRDLSTDKGRTILFVSHNIAALKRLCDKAFLLEYGALKMDGTLDSVIEEYIGVSEAQVYNSGKIEIAELDCEMEVSVPLTKEGARTLAPFSVEINISASKPAKRISVRVMIFQNSEYNIFTSDTLMSENLNTHLVEGQNKFICNITSLPLAAGNYQLGVIVHDPGIKTYYNNDNIIQFKVLEELLDARVVTNIPQWGNIYIPHKWEIKQNEQH
jgi:lipopolysaccharide transport system ATP-binding protein